MPGYLPHDPPRRSRLAGGRPAAKILSGFALVVFSVVVVDLVHRPHLPGFSYGGVALSRRRMRWLWFLFLVGGLGLGANRDPVVRQTMELSDPEAQEAATAGATTYSTSTYVPLPFYRYERESVHREGTLLEETRLEGVVLPWPYLWALLAYWFLVVRWNPESRWARRILQGKRKR